MFSPHLKKTVPVMTQTIFSKDELEAAPSRKGTATGYFLKNLSSLFNHLNPFKNFTKNREIPQLAHLATALFVRDVNISIIDTNSVHLFLPEPKIKKKIISPVKKQTGPGNTVIVRNEETVVTERKIDKDRINKLTLRSGLNITFLMDDKGNKSVGMRIENHSKDSPEAEAIFGFDTFRNVENHPMYNKINEEIIKPWKEGTLALHSALQKIVRLQNESMGDYAIEILTNKHKQQGFKPLEDLQELGNSLIVGHTVSFLQNPKGLRKVLFDGMEYSEFITEENDFSSQVAIIELYEKCLSHWAERRMNTENLKTEAILAAKKIKDPVFRTRKSVIEGLDFSSFDPHL